MPRFLAIAIVLLCMCVVGYAQAPADKSPHSEASLISEAKTAPSGGTFWVGLKLKHEDNWHSYWVNPGDSGTATSIAWRLPPGVKAGDFQWTYPEKIVLGPLASYGYSHELILPIQITVPASIKAGSTLKLEGTAKWLICDPEVCLPAEQEVALSIPVGDSLVEDAAGATAIGKALQKVPELDFDYKVTATKSEKGYLLSIKGNPEKLLALYRGGMYFFALDPATINHAALQNVKQIGSAKAPTELRMEIEKSEYATNLSNPLRGVMVINGFPTRAIVVEAPVEGVPLTPAKAAAAQTSAGASQPVTSAEGLTTSVAVLFAFIGGMILNLMPCVFPVLALKVFGFVNHAGKDATKVRLQGLTFGAGVVLSFVALALALLAIRAAGQQLGWGFQLQSPVFVGVMSLFLFAIGLNLLGVFEVGLSATRLGAVAGSGSYGESFFTGVLATIVATPCTAPFMGAALGYAFVSATKTQAFLIFLSMGIGMALPYVLLASSPKLTAWLPRPGAWMETFKQVMAFPMFATVIWLVWVFSLQTGSDGTVLMLTALLVLSIGLWAYGRWSTAIHKSSTRWAATFAMVIFAIASVMVTTRGAAQRLPADEKVTATSKGGWEPYSAARVEELRASGKPVFIDFTAAWCLSCQVNKKLVLTKPENEKAFADRGVALVRADWTNEDPEITKALASFGRSGVPLYVLYQPGAAQPKILPEVLTSDILMDALKDIPLTSVKN